VDARGSSLNTIRKGLIKRIHVDKHVIAANLKNGENNPPITIQTSKGPLKAHDVIIKGDSRTMYHPNNPLKCGARLWTETTAEVQYF
jgi:hypothetical protein